MSSEGSSENPNIQLANYSQPTTFTVDTASRNSLAEAEQDFQDPININIHKRQKIDHPNDGQPVQDSNEFATECSLCQKNWTNSGPHIIVSLKCGHLFGKSCISQYIRAGICKSNVKGTRSMCPTCGEPAKKHHIQNIWPSKVIPHDPKELNRLKQEINVLQEIISFQEEELALSTKTYQRACKVLSQYKLPIPQNNEPVNPEKDDLKIDKIQDSRLFAPWSSSSLSPNRNSCRVMAMDSRDRILVASLKHPTKGYGIHKTSLLDPLSTDFTPIHDGLIRDIVYSAKRGQILTTSIDKTLKISSALNNCVLQTYNLDCAGWSCDFDSVDPNILYCGLSNDTVMVYDIRNTKESLFRLRNSEITGGAQIHSLHTCVIEGRSTILCANSLKAYMWQSESTESNTEDDYICSLLNLGTEGYTSFSLSIDLSRQELLLSSRKHGSTQHIVASWDKSKKLFTSEWSIQSDISQKTLARTSCIQRGSQDPAVCYSDEKSGMLYIEDKDHEILTIPVGGQIMDIKYSKIDGEEILAGLTDDSLHLFKYQ